MSASIDLSSKIAVNTCKRVFDCIKKGDKFHFIAAGGVGQSALAKILVKSGYKVSGSDINDSKYLKELKNLGVKTYIGHNRENVPDDCFVVISSAIKEDNPELIRAKELKLTILHRSDILLALTGEFPTTIGFAGTHGKTTTSGLASYVLEKANKNPAYAVGGIIPELNTNANASKNSPLFIAELDESDGTIIKYSPEILVINNLEADHLDFYKNGLQDILDTFEKLILSEPDNVKIIANVDDFGVLELLERLKKTNCFKNIVKFSILNENNLQKSDFTPDIIAQNIKFDENGAEFEVVYKDELPVKINTSLKGMHNIYNTLAVATALIEAGYKLNDLASYFKGFTGMGRRFQTVFKSEKLEIIDDYAHHPNEIKATLKAAKEYALKSKRDSVIAIFQPHRYTRLKALWNEFLNAFDDCNTLIILDVFSAGDKFDSEFNSKNFAKQYNEKFPAKSAFYVEGKISDICNDLANIIKNNIKSSSNIILTLGAGDITKLGNPLAKDLNSGV